MKGFWTLGRATVERVAGDRPSRTRAGVGAAVAGAVVAAGVYKGLRSQPDR